MGSYHASKNTPRTGCIFAHTTNPQPKPFQPASSPPMQRNTPQCGVTKQCVAKECGAKMWRHRTMWRHQTMWRQTMWRQNVASQENVASPSNVAPNNAAPKCGATGKCGVTKQCGAKQCSANMWRHRKMRRHQTMWRQTMWRQMSSKCVFIMCLQRQVEKCVLFCQHRVFIYCKCLSLRFLGVTLLLKSEVPTWPYTAITSHVAHRGFASRSCYFTSETQTARALLRRTQPEGYSVTPPRCSNFSN